MQTARKSNESILTNLKQYGLHHRYLDVMIMDSSRPNWRKTDGWIDAIITDREYSWENILHVGVQRTGSGTNKLTTRYLGWGEIDREGDCSIKELGATKETKPKIVSIVHGSIT